MYVSTRIALERAQSAAEARRVLYLASFNSRPVRLVAYIERRAALMMVELRARIAKAERDIAELRERVEAPKS